jgi:hypothetical protein
MFQIFRRKSSFLCVAQGSQIFSSAANGMRFFRHLLWEGGINTFFLKTIKNASFFSME